MNWATNITKRREMIGRDSTPLDPTCQRVGRPCSAEIHPDPGNRMGSLSSVRDVRHAGRARHHDFRLEQLDERHGAGAEAGLLEQSLLLERLEVEILREGIHEILV